MARLSYSRTLFDHRGDGNAVCVQRGHFQSVAPIARSRSTSTATGCRRCRPAISSSATNSAPRRCAKKRTWRPGTRPDRARSRQISRANCATMRPDRSGTRSCFAIWQQLDGTAAARQARRRPADGGVRPGGLRGRLDHGAGRRQRHADRHQARRPLGPRAQHHRPAQLPAVLAQQRRRSRQHGEPKAAFSPAAPSARSRATARGRAPRSGRIR